MREYELPFRWDIRRRERLGGLLDEGGGGKCEDISDVLLDEVTEDCARIVALSGDGDVCFVGRSLESLFDYLSGLLIDTSWRERVMLLQFSWYGIVEVGADEVVKLQYYFEQMGLSPAQLVRRERAVVFVDIADSGGTFGNLIGFLYQWADEKGVDWNAVKRKIRLIGVTRRTKTTKSYTHKRWGSEEAARPDYAEGHLEALRFAVQCFERGREKRWRQMFARCLGRERTMKYAWMQALVQEVKC